MIQFSEFPLKTFDKIRYADTDRQGHVNNAQFSSYLETGRVEFLYHPDHQLLVEGASFVIISLALKFMDEIKWPGKIDIGTGIVKVGRSSIQIYQQLFQDAKCVARASTVIVQVKGGKSEALSPEVLERMQNWVFPQVILDQIT